MTGSGLVWLDEMADLMMLNAPIKGVPINRRMPMALLSEGWATLHYGWTTAQGSFRAIVSDPTGQKDLCYQEGAISYMPHSTMCCQHENVSQPAPGESPAEGGYKNAMTHIKAKIKTNQDEPASTILLDTEVAPAPLESTEIVTLRSAQELSGKDIEFRKVDNCPSQLEFGHSGGTEAKSPGTVGLSSGESCGVSVSAKPAGKKPKPTEPTTPTPGGMESEKWVSAEEWDINELEDDADLGDLTKPCE